MSEKVATAKTQDIGLISSCTVQRKTSISANRTICFNADLFAFVRPSTWFLRSTGAITFGVFEEKISDQPVRDYFAAQLGLPCYSQRTPHWMGKYKLYKFQRHSLCTKYCKVMQSGVWPLLFCYSSCGQFAMSLACLSLWGDVGSRRLGSLGILQAPGYWRRQLTIKLMDFLVSMVWNDKGR